MSTFVLNKGYSLQLPSSYVDIDREEMEYIDGGYTISLSRSTAATIIDVAAILISAGLSTSASVGKIAAKIGWSNLKTKVATAMLKLGVSKLAANTAVSILTTVTGFSLGSAAAWCLDKTDRSGLNGYIQY